MTTGEKVVQARTEANISRPQLADLTGIPVRSLEKLEQGVIKEPKLADIDAIAKVLGKTVLDFIADDAPAVPKAGRGRPTKKK